MSLPKKYLFWIQYPDQSSDEITPFEMVIHKSTGFEEFLYAACKHNLMEYGDNDASVHERMYNFPLLVLTGVTLHHGDNEIKMNKVLESMAEVLEQMNGNWLCVWNIVEKSEWTAYKARHDAGAKKKAAAASTASSSSLP